MKLGNVKCCISFDGNLVILDEVCRKVSGNEREVCENKEVYNLFMNKVLSNSTVKTTEEVDLWRGVGCIGWYSFESERFLVTSARWETDWEVTVSLNKYPNFLSKILQDSYYSQKIKILQKFSTLVFDAIQSEVHPSKISVFLSSEPKHEVNDINLLKW